MILTALANSWFRLEAQFSSLLLSVYTVITHSLFYLPNNYLTFSLSHSLTLSLNHLFIPLHYLHANDATNPYTICIKFSEPLYPHLHDTQRFNKKRTISFGLRWFKLTIRWDSKTCLENGSRQLRPVTWFVATIIYQLLVRIQQSHFVQKSPVLMNPNRRHSDNFHFFILVNNDLSKSKGILHGRMDWGSDTDRKGYSIILAVAVVQIPPKTL